MACCDQNLAEWRSASGNQQNGKTTARLRTAQPMAARLKKKADLVSRAHMYFGQHQDTELWNPQWSNECPCLSHACAIERVWEWIAPFLQKRASAKMVADLNFAVCVSFHKDKAKTKQLRFLPLTQLKKGHLFYISFSSKKLSRQQQ